MYVYVPLLTDGVFLLTPFCERQPHVFKLDSLQHKQDPRALGPTAIFKIHQLVGRHFTLYTLTLLFYVFLRESAKIVDRFVSAYVSVRRTAFQRMLVCVQRTCTIM